MTEPLTDVDIECRSCAGTYDACLASRDDCCPDCTHYDGESSDGDSVDEVAVDRACSGDRTLTLNRAETAEAWRRLEASGLSASRIQEVLGVTSRSVHRWRAELRGGVKEPSQPSRVGSLECRKGCGRVAVNGQGRAAHERNCTYEAAAA